MKLNNRSDKFLSDFYIYYIMKLYNSILSNVEDSINNADKIIDPINLLQVEEVNFSIFYFNRILNNIDIDLLKRYTCYMDSKSFSNVLLKCDNNIADIWLFEENTKDISIRLIWYICNELIITLKNADYDKNFILLGSKLNLDKIIKNKNFENFFVNIWKSDNKYKLSTRTTGGFVEILISFNNLNLT